MDRLAAALGRIQSPSGASLLSPTVNWNLLGSNASALLGRRALDVLAVSPVAIAFERSTALRRPGEPRFDALAMSALDTFRVSVVSPSWSSALQRIAAQAKEFYPADLLGLRSVERRLRAFLLPENLLKADVASWPWLLRISVKDGVCLAWAPRAELIEELMGLRTSGERHRLLVDRRCDVVDDVEETLAHVDHTSLSDDVQFALQAAACVRAGRHAAAQALLGNLLDTLMRRHGHTWLQGHFPQALFAGTSSHKMVAGALGTRSGAGEMKTLTRVRASVCSEGQRVRNSARSRSARSPYGERASPGSCEGVV